MQLAQGRATLRCAGSVSQTGLAAGSPGVLEQELDTVLAFVKPEPIGKVYNHKKQDKDKSVRAVPP